MATRVIFGNVHFIISSMLKVISYCSPELMDSYGNVFDDPVFDYQAYIHESIKLQMIDEHVIMFRVDNETTAIVNCDLISTKSGKTMYGIFDVKYRNGAAVFGLRRFLSGKMVHNYARKYKIKLCHLPSSSRGSAAFQQQLAHPDIAALREGIAGYPRYCALDCLPCIATVVMDRNSHHVQWVQIVYDKAEADYRGIGFKQINSSLLVHGWVSNLYVNLPGEILNIITAYSPKVIVSATGLCLDDVRLGNKILGPHSKFLASDDEFENYRTLGNEELCLNNDQSFGLAYPSWYKF